MGINAILPAQVLANGASDGDLLTVQADGSVAFETPAGGGLVSLPSADGITGSSSWWRSYGSDIALDINRRGDGVVERINQTAEGIE